MPRNERVEYSPFLSSAQETLSSEVLEGRACISLHRLSHSTILARPNCLLKRMRYSPGTPPATLVSLTVMNGSAQQAKRRGHLAQSGVFMQIVINIYYVFCFPIDDDENAEST
jgi:hypothetical protein